MVLMINFLYNNFLLNIWDSDKQILQYPAKLDIYFSFLTIIHVHPLRYKFQ